MLTDICALADHFLIALPNTNNLDNGKFCISAASNQIATNQLVRDVHIAIEGRNYSADLVILLGLGIDVILGMNWMSKHGVLIYTVDGP